jgi:hypothetical protein
MFTVTVDNGTALLVGDYRSLENKVSKQCSASAALMQRQPPRFLSA